ncbi:1-phosphofructokinase [Clostridium sp. P21]|uniref:Tagatose-6-phosphate kinase n=1 Tax=Clostridium muellerianum TaxID=2716538 RepID=A0A7Y0EIV2_9CLOT|nr:1-phosphofructokinase [Clostridium muellerianum]NMM64268.1 1-phosphofructokinase [Clostridium muellerianum]
MIYTLTTNPAIDMNCYSSSSEPFKVNRTNNLSYSPNGKGVNVSLVLNHYSIESKAIGFFGGFTGKYIVDELNKRNISTIPFWIEENTRINVFITVEGNKEFKYVNKGPFVPEETQKDLLEYLSSNLKKEDYLIISGSLPQSIKQDYYNEILDICAEKNVEVVLDISSKKLRELLKYKPLLIKPNDDEVKEIFGVDLKDENDIKNALKYINKLGARNILLTLGENGMYFYDGKKTYYCTAPKIKLLSSACAGDSSLAAFLSEWIFEGDIEKALKKASATGANVAESSALGDLKKVSTYMQIIDVKEVM